MFTEQLFCHLSETWTVYRLQVKTLHAYMRHLRQIMSILWKDMIRNSEILERAGLPSVTDILRWLGQVYRMSDDRLPTQLLYSQLLVNVAKRNIKWRKIDTRQWQSQARDRPTCRTLIRP